MIVNKDYKNLIKRITSSNWEYGNKFCYISILICFTTIAYYNLNIGFVMSPDSFKYSESGDILIKLNFNLFNYYSLKSISDYNPSFIYTIPVILISFSKFFFGNEWQFAFMVINLFSTFFTLIFFSKILLLLKIRPLIISLAIPIMVLSVDLLTWPRYILTDSIFSFLVIFTIYFMTKCIIKNKFFNFALVFVIFLLFLTRPTSPPFIFAIIFFIAVSKIKFSYSPKLILLTIFSLFILTPFIFAILHQFMNDYLINNAQVFFYTEMVKTGVIIHHRPDTAINSPNTFFDIVYLYYIRILFFFNPYAKSFSDIHLVLNSIQAFYIFLSIAAWSFLSINFKLFNKIVFLILLISFFVSSFHAFTLIDYDWRYRFPIILPMLIIFPISCKIFLRKIYTRNF